MRIIERINDYLKTTDRMLTILCLGLSTLSIFLLYGINQTGYSSVTLRSIAIQILAIILGIVAAIVVSLVDYRELVELWRYYIPIAMVLVFITYFFGMKRYDNVDDRAWLQIPFINLTFQPSEILKIAFILSFALHLEKVKENINELPILIRLCIHGAIPVLMIMAQGDDGSALVILVIFCVMIFSAGLSWHYINMAIVTVALATPLVWFSLSTGKKMRILTIFHPELDPKGYGFQQLQSSIAIGSGQLWGKGIFSTDHVFVPEMHNDFVFAFFSESFGFIGAMGLVVVFLTLLLTLLRIAFSAKDILGRYICVGVFAVIAFQIAVNIGMCLSLMPVIGVTLPLVSAGGTSVCMTYLAIGLVLSVHRHSDQNLFLNK